MALTTVTVTWDENDIGQAPLGGNITFLLSEPVFDSADGIDVRPTPKTYFFASATGTGTSDPLVANDNASLQPSGSYYTVTVAITGQAPYVFQTAINHANGASQTLSFLQANAAVPAAQYSAYLPLPSGTPLAGQVPAVITDGSTATAWTTGGGTGGGVSSVSAGDASIQVGGTGTSPTVETGRLDQIATLHPPTSAVAMNSQKITGQANGTVATDSAAFGQIPTTLPPNGAAGGDLSGTYPNPTVAKAGGVAFGTAAFQPSSAFDAAGLASAAQAAAIAAIPAIDPTATDIQPLGTQAAGSTGKTADAGHVHPLPGGFLPSDMNLAEWNFDPAVASTTSALATSGQITLIRVPVRYARPISNVNIVITAAGATLTSGQNFAAIITGGGTVVAVSADQTSSWLTTGFMTIPLVGAPFQITSPWLWVALLWNGTTGPSLLRQSNTSTAAANLGLGPSSARFAHTTGALTAMPASITPSANVLTQITFWAGLS